MMKYYHDIPAWLDGTTHLPDGEYRAYHVIICLIYLRDGPIALNEKGIAGSCNQHVNAFRSNLRKLVEKGKLVVNDGKISNPRANAEIARFRAQPEHNLTTPKGHQPCKPLKNKNSDGRTLLSFLPTEDSLTQGVEEKREISKGSFDEFWNAYPHKVGKAAARLKFAMAMRKVLFSTLMDALARYVAKTDDRPWCNPATWLHQERWTDEPAKNGGQNGKSLTAAADRLVQWADDQAKADASSEGFGRLLSHGPIR